MGATPQISIVVPFHAEGEIASRSIAAVRSLLDGARNSDLEVECLFILDRATEDTAKVFAAEALPDQCRVIEVANGDLGSTRNDGAKLVKGEILLHFDGDDLLEPDYLAKLVQCLQADPKSPESVYHPQYVVHFGGQQAIVEQFSSDHSLFDASALARLNLWNACVAGRTELFLRHPYRFFRASESGFGYEDWHWNCETLAAGIRHAIVPEGVHFVRKKAIRSLSNSASQANALLAPTSLFKW